ncbi:MAG: hypothetical protein IKS20_14990 [Victivallales bacterium]|nr:hypothetical protein [Victivallales bacterium]
MNRIACFLRFWLVLLLLSPVFVWAQNTQTGAEEKVKVSKNFGVDIRKLEIDVEKTPKTKGSRNGSSGSGARWLVVKAQVNISGQEWLDEFEARWNVLVDCGSKKKPILLPLNTKFVHLEKGKNYISAFVHPTFFKKYLDTESVNTSKISATLDIAVNGKVMARKSKGSKTGLVRTPAKCKVDSNGLMPRSKTPFADVDFDYYANEKID